MFLFVVRYPCKGKIFVVMLCNHFHPNILFHPQPNHNKLMILRRRKKPFKPHIPSHSPLRHQTDVLLLILFRDANLITIILQFVMQYLAQYLKINAEPQFQAAFIDIIISHPYQRIIELGIDGFDIFGGEFFVQHAFVKWHCKSRVYEFGMEQCDGNEPANKFEILQMIRIHVAGWIYLQTVVILVGIFEETVHRIEHLVR